MITVVISLISGYQLPSCSVPFSVCDSGRLFNVITFEITSRQASSQTCLHADEYRSVY